MSERLVRFGFAGLIFLISTVVFTWLLGFDIVSLALSINNELESRPVSISLITAAVSLTLGTPAIGFILSTTFAYPILWWWSRWGFYSSGEEFKNEYYRLLLKKLQNASGLKRTDNGHKVSSFKRRTVRVAHDVLFRSNVNEESLKYTARRLDIFWTHVNNLAAIFWAFYLACFINYNYGGFGDIDPKKWLVAAPFILYIGFAILAGRRDLFDSMHFEKAYLARFDHIRFEKKEKNGE